MAHEFRSFWKRAGINCYILLHIVSSLKNSVPLFAPRSCQRLSREFRSCCQVLSDHRVINAFLNMLYSALVHWCNQRPLRSSMMHGYRFCPSHQRTKSWWFGRVQWPGCGMWRSKIGEDRRREWNFWRSWSWTIQKFDSPEFLALHHSWDCIISLALLLSWRGASKSWLVINVERLKADPLNHLRTILAMRYTMP